MAKRSQNCALLRAPLLTRLEKFEERWDRLTHRVGLELSKFLLDSHLRISRSRKKFEESCVRGGERTPRSFLPETDDYALVCFEALRLTVVVVFPRETIASVCELLGKKHSHQDRTLSLTRRNLMAILESEEHYLPLGVTISRA